MERLRFHRQGVLIRRLLPVLAAGTLLAGCGLFDLREPEEPSGEEIPWEQQVGKRIALKNLEVATENLTVGNFERSLTADYRFRFDFGDVVGEDTVWTRERDIQALTTVFQNDVAEVDLTWTVGDSGDIGADKFYRNLRYLLVFRRSATDSSVYGGQCYMYFRFDGTQWFIYRWVDFADTTAAQTWGHLRRNPTEP